MSKEDLGGKGYKEFGLRDSLAYAAGDFGCNMSFALKGTLVIFWTQFMGMDSVLYAGLLLIVQVWDAINDPIIGSVIDADNRQYKINKFLHYIYIGSIGLAIAGAMCFIPAAGMSKIAKAIIFVAGYMIWDAFYTITNVPYGSLLALISNDAGDRASLSAFRSLGSIIGQLIPMIVLPFIIYDKENEILGERVFIVALILGIIGFVSIQFMIRNTEVRVESKVKVGEDATKFNVLVAMKNFIKNRPAMGATLAAIGLFIILNGVTAAITVVFQSYFKNVQFQGIAYALTMAPSVLFAPIARKMVMKYGKKEISAAGSVLSIVAAVAMIILPFTPDNKGLTMYMGCQVVFALGIGIFNTVNWSIMGDAIDYNEWKNGNREEGTVYALHSFFRKLAQGVGPSVILLLMVAAGYVEGDKGHQSMGVAENILDVVGWSYMVSAVLLFIGLAIVNDLNKEKLAEMQEDLARKEHK